MDLARNSDSEDDEPLQIGGIPVKIIRSEVDLGLMGANLETVLEKVRHIEGSLKDQGFDAQPYMGQIVKFTGLVQQYTKMLQLMFGVRPGGVVHGPGTGDGGGHPAGKKVSKSNAVKGGGTAGPKTKQKAEVQSGGGIGSRCVSG